MLKLSLLLRMLAIILRRKSSSGLYRLVRGPAERCRRRQAYRRSRYVRRCFVS